AGGFSLHASLRMPAVIAPDGSAVFLDASSGATTAALRYLNAAGEEVRAVSVAPIAKEARFNTLTRLADGSILVAGADSEAFVAKVTPGGTLDTAFGTAGIVRSKPGIANGSVFGLGVRPDGNVALQMRVSVLA